jgi:hypothetical protein
MKDQHLLTRIKICLENKHVTFTSNNEANTWPPIKGSSDSTSAPSQPNETSKHNPYNTHKTRKSMKKGTQKRA